MGLTLQTSRFWDVIHLEIRENLVKNKLGWPSFRFSFDYGVLIWSPSRPFLGFGGLRQNYNFDPN